MDVEGGVRVVLQLLEVSKDFVVGCRAKYSLEMKIQKAVLLKLPYPCRTFKSEEYSASR